MVLVFDLPPPTYTLNVIVLIPQKGVAGGWCRGQTALRCVVRRKSAVVAFASLLTAPRSSPRLSCSRALCTVRAEGNGFHPFASMESIAGLCLHRPLPLPSFLLPSLSLRPSLLSVVFGATIITNVCQYGSSARHSPGPYTLHSVTGYFVTLYCWGYRLNKAYLISSLIRRCILTDLS